MAKAHKKQHYVPASYLKKWIDPSCKPNHEPYVWVFEKEGRDVKSRAPKNIFTETDLYTIESADGSRDLRIENSLAGLESRFASIRKSKFDSLRELTEEEFAYVCAFVAAAQIRTTSSRDHHATQWGNVLKRADHFSEAIKKATPKQKLAAAMSSQPPSRRNPSLTLEQVRQLAEKPLQLMMPSVLNTVTPVLMGMDLAILCTNDPVGFITSDNPCIWYDPENYKLPPIYRGAGLGSRSIEISMPISPSQYLVFNRQGINGYLMIDENYLNLANAKQRGYSNESVISNTHVWNENWNYIAPMPDDAWENQNKKDEDQ